MSLISQNMLPKKRREKIDGEAADGLVDEHKLKNSKRKNRGRDYDLLEGNREQEKEMKKLESFLFGTLHSPVEFGKEAGGEEEEVAQDVPLFFVDKSTGDEMVVYEEDLHSRIEERRKEEKKPAWVDDEEERTEVDIVKVNRLRKLRKEADERVISGADYVARLRAQHAKLNPGTEWARIDQKSAHVGASDDESDDESGVTVAHGYEDMEGGDILRSNDKLVVKGRDKLLPGLLEYSRLMNANSEEPSNGPINSVQFHRNGQLLLTAGLDRGLRFFQVDGKHNTKIQSIFIEDCPIYKASFLPDGSEVIISGRRKFFYSFDLVKAAVSKIGPLTGREEKSLEVFEVSPDSSTIAFIGNEGYILLMSSRTKELIGTVKMNGSARSLAFADGGQQLLSSGGDGQVYHWDLRTRRCIHKAVDEGCIVGSALCVSPDNSLFAAGSSSGIVNVYKRGEFLGGKRKPLKTIENLTTMVDFMKFNHDGQILAISSRMKKNGLKLIHVPSFTAFSNCPPPRFSLHYPRALDFSPHGGFMAMGNAGGKVLLYKLHHYQYA
ncbi:U3 small nucleolar RNA-associated protein 18 homolog [Phoenix dactylifera]|uniref:U3 small nucleolar RNA-associated protein 18 homolog n=1 Tax=Phoenix dactylifera TaxID=42345 RepID=A0A8B9AH10_PHODC|nr:U3 small nucleolar RNA-associated protein 18 homolog [Phoenix dactylifera]XP_038983273.1 U3 small nucleolar RNA-associated protein 18 homolog [Phoenix dactylifera]